MNRFGFGSVRVIPGSGQFGSFGFGSDQFNSGHFRFGFRINSGQHDFGSVRFWAGSILVSDRIRFRSFGCRFESDFGSFGLVHSVRISFARSTCGRVSVLPPSLGCVSSLMSCPHLYKCYPITKLN